MKHGPVPHGEEPAEQLRRERVPKALQAGTPALRVERPAQVDEAIARRLHVVEADAASAVDSLIQAREALVRPGIDEDVRGDAQSLQRERRVFLRHAVVEHLLRHRAVGSAYQCVEKALGGRHGQLLRGRQEMKRHPHATLGRGKRDLGVQLFVRGAQARVTLARDEADGAFADGVVHVLRRDGDRERRGMVKSGQARHRVGHGEVKVLFHPALLAEIRRLIHQNGRCPFARYVVIYSLPGNFSL